MEFDVNDVLTLLQKAAEKADLGLEHGNFGELSIYLEENRKDGDARITEDYLYKNLYRPSKNSLKDGDQTISANQGYLNSICRSIGFRNFEQFQSTLSSPIHPILKSCESGWYCYVRRNTKESVIYQSPVRIYEGDHKMHFELKGPSQRYKGHIRLKNDCLFCNFSADNEKEFLHIYRIGSREKPKVLTGVFAGISTAGFPIGGRVVLIREEVPFGELKNRQFSIAEAQNMEEMRYKKLSKFFQSYEDNNLRIENPITFDLDDLEL
ncbi:hypothetical protein QQ008_29830 [Fulvivirgaceae bacterium BMA10]|uniref:Uncharacterized protein n=1 Tax=Splendidivirga corallicola TaxID=3051826 RepID=A0ABT8L0D8_9BACT|nr:hypothetical protein [Fulvivirgaceae bacterium BMA10]